MSESKGSAPPFAKKDAKRLTSSRQSESRAQRGRQHARQPRRQQVRWRRRIPTFESNRRAHRRKSVANCSLDRLHDARNAANETRNDVREGGEIVKEVAGEEGEATTDAACQTGEFSEKTAEGLKRVRGDRGEGVGGESESVQGGRDG